MEKQLTGVELIAKERERQIKLGYDSQHDREHQPMDLVCAADAYICSAEGFAAPQGYSTWPWAQEEVDALQKKWKEYEEKRKKLHA